MSPDAETIGDTHDPSLSADGTDMGKAALVWLRSHVVGVVAIIGLVTVGAVVAVPAVISYGPDHPAGQTRRITLEWECSNHIEWRQPGTSWTWVGASEGALPPELSTSGVSDDEGWVTQRARGELHFDSNTRATFTSDNGSILRMERHGEPFFRNAACAIGG